MGCDVGCFDCSVGHSDSGGSTYEGGGGGFGASGDDVSGSYANEGGAVIAMVVPMMTGWC